MVSDSDTLVLCSVPVHPSSRSPTDERWKQIWGNRALFCCLTDLSESSLACRFLYPSQTDTSGTQFHPLGILASRLCLPVYLIYSLLVFLFPFAPGPLCAFHYLSRMFRLFRRCLVCMPISCGTQRVSITVTQCLEASLLVPELECLAPWTAVA